MNRPTFRALFPVLGALTLLVSAGCQRSLLAVRESGDYNYTHGQYEAAVMDFTEYVERSPGRPEVYHMLGKTYLAMGQTGMARENLLIAHSLRLEDDEVFADTCAALFADKQYEDLNRLLRSRTYDRGRMQDYMLLAYYTQMQGDYDEAQRALLTAAKVDGGMSVQPQLGLAKVYVKVGDRQRAISRLRMAYFIDPANGEVAELAAEMGEIVGPSFGVVPEERATVTGSRPYGDDMTNVPTETPRPRQ